MDCNTVNKNLISGRLYWASATPLIEKVESFAHIDTRISDTGFQSQRDGLYWCVKDQNNKIIWAARLDENKGTLSTAGHLAGTLILLSLADEFIDWFILSTVDGQRINSSHVKAEDVIARHLSYSLEETRRMMVSMRLIGGLKPIAGLEITNGEVIPSFCGQPC